MLPALFLFVVVVGAGAGSDGAATPRELLDQLAAGFESGDGEAVSRLVDGSTPTGRTVAEAMGVLARIFDASRELERSAVEKFGDAGAAVIRESGTNPARDFREVVEGAEVTVDGGTARVTSPGAGDALHLVERQGRWYVDPTSMTAQGSGAAAQQQTAEMMLRTFEALHEVMRDRSLVDDAASPEELRRNLATRMMSAMMAAMGSATQP